MKIDKSFLMRLFGSLLIPLMIFLRKPLGMNSAQAMVLASTLTVIIWWTINLFPKAVSSLLLLLSFVLFSGVSPKVIFAFPLTNTFLLIVITYLLSQGISNSGIAEKCLKPLLTRYGKTPEGLVLLAVICLAITIFIIPQPLARLIIVAGIFDEYLKKSDCPKDTREVILFAIFLFYVIVNASMVRADLILNSTVVAVSNLNINDSIWIKYMLIPTIAYGILIFVVWKFLFRKQLHSITIHTRDEKEEHLTKKDKWMLLVMLCTACLWLSESWHGIPAWLIATICTILFFQAGFLHVEDCKKIDITTLFFLTAAMSIGGVMRECGAAYNLFEGLQRYFHAQSYFQSVIMVMALTMVLHMFLGSNTTTLSVVIPSLILLYGETLQPEMVMFIAYIAACTHWLFPYHSLGMMIGNTNGYFSTEIVTKMGFVMTGAVIIGIVIFYLPWWHIVI